MSTTYVELNREAPSGNVPNAWSRVRSYSKGRPLAATYGIAVVVTITAAYLCSLVGILPADPDAMDLSAMNQSPSLEHLLGTDFVGRDLLTRIMVGTQAFFLPGLLAVAVSLVLGSFFGVLAGFWPERFETPVGLFLQLLESLPKLVLVLLVIALYRPNIYLVLIVVGITNVPATAELLRAKIASLRSKSYIEAALALGLHPRRVILKHLLWLHGRGILLVQASLAMGEAILIETSLSYLGFGVQEPTPSWGNNDRSGKGLLLPRRALGLDGARPSHSLHHPGFLPPRRFLERDRMSERRARREIDDAVLHIKDLRTYFYLQERGRFLRAVDGVTLTV